ncbi:centrosome-associated protein 350-like [Chiloscyllium plagiosum]|uniref:centrosome-associated protein 350-like n=1 Tax=Chiloscyllium plagiosum TaxID=36176 RepID=UPI001CB7E646|nr:centrosome-associated protein 350-like [Chiloscyllium plagiosum]XP_043540235.1 centrosome-associated protein 350-like [Chiloscyllium plagiosum]
MLSSPPSVQHHMTAQHTYLDAIEESICQLSEIDTTRGVALAQQETVSLAQILKAQQQRHEHDIALLKLKAEQEAAASQRQLEEARQKAVQVLEHVTGVWKCKEFSVDCFSPCNKNKQIIFIKYL